MYTKIAPFGPREGFGTFDTFFDSEKYADNAAAWSANDLVIANFVTDKKGIIYFELYGTRNPDEKVYYRLNYQNFPFGVDVGDDQACQSLAQEIIAKNRNGSRA